MLTASKQVQMPNLLPHLCITIIIIRVEMFLNPLHTTRDITINAPGQFNCVGHCETHVAVDGNRKVRPDRSTCLLDALNVLTHPSIPI